MSTVLSRSLFDFFDLSWDGIALVVRDPWRIVFVNATLSQWIGEPIADRPIEDLLGGISVRQLHAKLDRVWKGEIDNSVVPAGLIYRGEGLRDVPVEVRLKSVHLDEQALVGMVIRRTDAPVENLPSYRRDPLTGMADRSVLLSRLATLLGGDRSVDRSFGVLFVDLDNFKQVNDQFGHLVGDRALSEVAQRLAQSIRAHDQVFRYGGDEFVVLVEQAADEFEIEPVVGRIHAELSQPIIVRNEVLHLSASIGVAEIGSRHRTPEDVLLEADRAMYAAKRLAILSARAQRGGAEACE